MKLLVIILAMIFLVALFVVGLLFIMETSFGIEKERHYCAKVLGKDYSTWSLRSLDFEVHDLGEGYLNCCYDNYNLTMKEGQWEKTKKCIGVIYSEVKDGN